MSLITLRSTQQDNGATVSQSASNFTNHFKEGIVLGPGNTIELVSMSIVKLSKYEVIQGENDTFIWRIGAGPSSLGGTPTYSQHVVTLVPGSYNGQALATHITEQLNNSTLLGVYKGKWTCVYSSETKDDNAKFTINYGQNATPTPNAELVEWTQTYGAGSPFTLLSEPTENTTRLKFTQTAMGSHGVNSKGYGFHSDRGIFSNGGQNQIIINPVELLDEIDFVGAGSSQFLNFNNNNGNTVQVVFTAPALPNGWTTQLEIFSGDPGNIKTFDLQGVLGEIDTLHTFNAGTGYVVGDEGSFTGGSGTGATYKVTAISAGGGVTTADITNPGQGYQINDDLTFAGKGDGLSTCKVQNVKTGNDGTAYAIGDEGDLVYRPGPGAGSGTGGKYKITAVGAGGQISALEITDGGKDYAQGEVLICDGKGNSDGKIRVTSVDNKSFIKYGVTDESGQFGIGTNKGVSALDEANWDRGTFILNGTTSPRRLTQSKLGDGTPVGDFPMELETQAGGGYAFTLFKTYPCMRIGYARQQLVNGDFSNVNAVYTNANKGLDCQVVVEPNSTHDGLVLNVYQLAKQAGRNYPVAGWRDTKIILEDLEPTAWSDMPQGPTDWTTFNYGDDKIRITMEIDANRNIQFSSAHDASQNGNFTEEEVWLKTGDKVADSNGDMDNDFETTIREILYPLHSVIFVGPGTPFSTQTIDLSGIYDTSVIKQDMELRGINGEIETEATVHEEVGMDVGVEATPLTLSAIYKMGVLTGTDIYNGPPTGAGANQISNRSVNPNTGNINLLLGLERGYTFQSGQQTNAISTDDDAKPNPSLSEPALHVELPDFNIKSYSGASSDTGRAIAVIPKEQWTTDEQTGVLHFQSQYPIAIDLNLPHPRPFYELTARLRQPNGQVADDLINPTEITVKIGENEESRQSRVMMKAMERLGEIVGNRQDGKISRTDDNIPLI